MSVSPGITCETSGAVPAATDVQGVPSWGASARGSKEPSRFHDERHPPSPRAATAANATAIADLRMEPPPTHPAGPRPEGVRPRVETTRPPGTRTGATVDRWPTLPFTVLSIGGSDPTGGAGVAGDLKTVAAHGAYGAAVVAAVTAQNHRGVTAAVEIAPDLVRAQVEAVLAQVAPRAVKTGMLFAPATVAAVGRALANLGAPLVVDPVLSASAGGTLARAGLLEALAAHLLPRAAVVTPNLDEAAAALGWAVAPGAEVAAARALRSRWGGVAVLLKGGHGTGDRAVDVLATAAASSPLVAAALDRTARIGCALGVDRVPARPGGRAARGGRRREGLPPPGARRGGAARRRPRSRAPRRARRRDRPRRRGRGPVLTARAPAAVVCAGTRGPLRARSSGDAS
jgi:hydroxymethylpyrimidine/phosphomethylpyrimidine kinase